MEVEAFVEVARRGMNRPIDQLFTVRSQCWCQPLFLQVGVKLQSRRQIEFKDRIKEKLKVEVNLPILTS